jgi:hypothetical protein
MPSTVLVDDVTIDESQTFVDFTVRLDTASATPLSVRYATTNNTARYGSDYTYTDGTLNFAAGETVKTVRVAILADGTAEGTEDFFLSLGTPVNALIGRAFARASIIDNDGPSGTPRVSVGDVVVDEADRTARFVVTLDRPSTGTVSMNFATADGTAQSGADFTAAAGALSFAPGETAKTISVALANDTQAESAEWFALNLSGFVNATSLDPSAIATIFGNDGPVLSQPSIHIDDVTVDETQDFADLIVRLSAPGNAPVSVRYATSNDVARYGSDYSYLDGTLNFAVGETVKTVRVTLLDDTTVEGNEDFFVALGTATNALIGDAFARVSIVDNDALSGTPRVSVDDLVVDEADREARFVITLDRPSTSVVSMSYATVDGTAQADRDFVTSAGTLNFAPGETAKTVRVALIDDGVAEGTETFELLLTNLANASVLDPSATVRIFANDGQVVSQPTISIDDLTVDESQAHADVIVRLSAPGTSPVSVRYATSNELARYGADYEYLDGTLNFAVGETVKTVRITLRDDVTVEETEDFYITLGTATNALIGDAFARVTLIDNDALSGTPRVSVSDLVVDEADREAHFVVTLDRPSTSVVSMAYTTRDGTAQGGSDFVITSGALRFAPGETARTVSVTLTNDTQSEDSEWFALQLEALVDATTLDPSAIARIHRNDGQVVSQPTISIDDVTVDESQAYADVVVRLSAPGTNPVSVRYATANDLARYGSDYAYLDGTLNFATGETVKTVRVTLQDDVGVEETESFLVTLGTATNALIGDAHARVTIIDNDALSGTPRVSIDGASVDEADGFARFVVRLDRPSTGVVGMRYATVEGTANAGRDFTAAAGDLYFAPGETAKTVEVALLDDTTAESIEHFALTISHLTGASAPAPSAVATIGASDGAVLAQPSISVADIVVDESAAYADFTVRLSAPSNGPVSVRYATGNDTARYGSDYAYLDGTLNFAAGETVKTVRIALEDDAAVEPAERFHLNLANATGATIGNTRASATLLDDDGNAQLTGGAGNNDFVIEDPSARVVEGAAGGTDLVRSSVDHALDANVENLELQGNAALDGFGNGLANRITGNAGDNMLSGGGGNDTLDGGAGFDVAAFSGARADYIVRKTGTQWQVQARTGNDGTDQLVSIEAIAFGDMGVSLTLPARTSAPVYGQSNGFLFDPVFYLLDNPELVSTVTLTEAFTHYLGAGSEQGRTPNGWFDAAWYANRWDDLRPLNLDAATLFQHYNLFGVWEGRAAGPAVGAFDGNRYLADNPDVAAYVDAFIGDFLGSRTNGAIAHYVIYGAAEGRIGHDTAGAAIDLGFAV